MSLHSLNDVARSISEGSQYVTELGHADVAFFSLMKKIGGIVAIGMAAAAVIYFVSSSGNLWGLVPSALAGGGAGVYFLGRHQMNKERPTEEMNKYVDYSKPVKATIKKTKPTWFDKFF